MACKHVESRNEREEGDCTAHLSRQRLCICTGPEAGTHNDTGYGPCAQVGSPVGACGRISTPMRHGPACEARLHGVGDDRAGARAGGG